MDGGKSGQISSEEGAKEDEVATSLALSNSKRSFETFVSITATP